MKNKFLEYQLESEYISPTETILWVVYLMGKKAFWSEKQIIIHNLYWKYFQVLINFLKGSFKQQSVPKLQIKCIIKNNNPNP